MSGDSKKLFIMVTNGPENPEVNIPRQSRGLFTETLFKYRMAKK